MMISAKKFLNRFLTYSAVVSAIVLVSSTAFAETTYKDVLKSVDDAAVASVTLKRVNKANWYPSYHIAPNAFSMGVPNAVIYFKNEYHLFYEQQIDDMPQGKTFWAHISSPDLIKWKTHQTALAPFDAYDKDGISGGSAVVEEDLLYLLYTGSAKNKLNDKIVKHESQNLAMSKDGTNFVKSANNPVIKTAPHFSYLEFSQSDFKNPYVWKKEDRYYAIVGTQYEKTKDGAVLLFKSKDLRNWVFINVTALGQKGEMGLIWESPSLIHIGLDDVLSVSSQGIKPHEKMFLNKYQSGVFLGKLDYNSGRFTQKSPFVLLDYGFDFYAPKFTRTPDGRTIFVGWMGMEGSVLSEKSEGWSGMMTLPRELKLVDGKPFTPPAKELLALRGEKISLPLQSLTGEKEFGSIKGDTYEIDAEFDITNAKNITLKLRTSSSQETVLSYDNINKILRLNRDKSGKNLVGEREVKLPVNENILKLRIYVDKSSVEVFANDGQVVLSSRIYPDKNSTGVKIISDGEAKLKKFDFYKL